MTARVRPSSEVGLCPTPPPGARRSPAPPVAMLPGRADPGPAWILLLGGLLLGLAPDLKARPPAARGPALRALKRLAGAPWFKERFDLDGDGRLQDQERATATREIDLDGNGTVDSQEVFRFAASRGPLGSLHDLDHDGQLEDAEWRALVAKVDRDGDGEIDPRETELYLTRHKILTDVWVIRAHDLNHDEHLDATEEARVLAEADADRDGAITPEEARAYLSRVIPHAEELHLLPPAGGRLKRHGPREETPSSPGIGFLEKYDREGRTGPVPGATGKESVR